MNLLIFLSNETFSVDQLPRPGQQRDAELVTPQFHECLQQLWARLCLLPLEQLTFDHVLAACDVMNRAGLRLRASMEQLFGLLDGPRICELPVSLLCGSRSVQLSVRVWLSSIVPEVMTFVRALVLVCSRGRGDLAQRGLPWTPSAALSAQLHSLSPREFAATSCRVLNASPEKQAAFFDGMWRVFAPWLSPAQSQPRPGATRRQLPALAAVDALVSESFVWSLVALSTADALAPARFVNLYCQQLAPWCDPEILGVLHNAFYAPSLLPSPLADEKSATPGGFACDFSALRASLLVPQFSQALHFVVEAENAANKVLGDKAVEDSKADARPDKRKDAKKPETPPPSKAKDLDACNRTQRVSEFLLHLVKQICPQRV